MAHRLFLGEAAHMIVDVRDGDMSLDRTAQVVIVGAGPAGLTLARCLADVADVLVIESGGFHDSPAQQDLLVGESVGVPYPLTETRIRQFGGSSSLWAGYCAVFDRHDFAERRWVPHSGWPFDVDALEPYFGRVADTLHLPAVDFLAPVAAAGEARSLTFERGVLAPTVWRFGAPTMRIGDEVRDELEQSSRITTLLGANVVDIRLDDDHGTVQHLGLRTLDGREGRVSADVIVLACGGLETARLLLCSDQQLPDGVANSSGMVGRCFMEHPHRSITPLAMDGAFSLDGWTSRGTDGDREYMSCIGLSPEAQEELEVLNGRAHIYRTPDMHPDEVPRVGLFMEQAPNPESRVLLSNRRDPLGMRRIRLDWQLTDLDWTSYERTASILGEEFERKGAGRMLGPIRPDARHTEPVLHSNHHLGTTRMSADKEDGVVDPDCRAHDVANLYIIGGSIFPTVSWANPTFTVLSVTYRLADHLRGGRIIAERPRPL